jgi:hypothetical protein
MRLHVAAGVVERQPTDLHARDLLARAEAAISQPDDEPARSNRRPVLRVA